MFWWLGLHFTLHWKGKVPSSLATNSTTVGCPGTVSYTHLTLPTNREV